MQNVTKRLPSVQEVDIENTDLNTSSRLSIDDFQSCSSRWNLDIEVEEEDEESPPYITAQSSLHSDFMDLESRKRPKNRVRISEQVTTIVSPDDIHLEFLSDKAAKQVVDWGPSQGCMVWGDRGKWESHLDFLVAFAACTIGTGAFWKFPFLCFKHHGGTFIIAYTFMFVIGALPLAFMEVLVGQTLQVGPRKAFRTLTPAFQGLGTAMVIMAFVVSITDSSVLAWAMFYMSTNFGSSLPWRLCTHPYNTDECYSPWQNTYCTKEKYGVGVFYNRSCYSVAYFCEIHNYIEFNSSHCLTTSQHLTIPVEDVTRRILPAIEFFEIGILDFRNSSWNDLGKLKGRILACMFFIWLLLIFCVLCGTRSLSRFLLWTMVISYVILLLLLAFTMYFPGTLSGMLRLILETDFSKLYSAELWRAAASQVLYSMNTSFGCLIVLASYSKRNFNCHMDTFLVGGINYVTSFLAALLAYGVMGIISKMSSTSFSDFHDPINMVFTIFPDGFSMLPGARLINFSFFFMMFLLRAGSEVILIETVVSEISDKYPHSDRIITVPLVCFVSFLLTIPICLQGGLHILKLFDEFITNWVILIIAGLEIYITAWVYGPKKMVGLLDAKIGKLPKPLEYYWKISWILLLPVTLVGLCIFSIHAYTVVEFAGIKFPEWTSVIGWMMVFVPCFFVIIGTMKHFLKQHSKTDPEADVHIHQATRGFKGTPVGRFKSSMMPVPKTRYKM